MWPRIMIMNYFNGWFRVPNCSIFCRKPRLNGTSWSFWVLDRGLTC